MERVKSVKIIGHAKNKDELAYIDRIRNLGYESIRERVDKRGKSFFHTLRWVKNDPRNRLPYAKTGWPKLKRYLTLPQKRQIYSSQGWTRDQNQGPRQH